MDRLGGEGSSRVLEMMTNPDEESSVSEEDEVACFEDDTESFMQRMREFVFSDLPRVVINQDFVSIEGTGGAVWRSSIQFSEFVCSEEGRCCLPLEGKSLLEVGSGLGLGAIVAWHLGASPVVATDTDSENGPLATLARNIAENCGRAASARTDSGRGPRHAACGWPLGDMAAGAQPRHAPEPRNERGPRMLSAATGFSPPPRVQSLRWGDRAQLAEAVASYGGFGPDVVLACDVAFDASALQALVETLAEACALPTREGARPRLCVSHQKRNRAREDSFFAALAGRLGHGEWRTVHQRDDLSVLVFAPFS